jgi:hypothetical protein
MADFLVKSSKSFTEFHIINEFLVETQRGIQFNGKIGKYLQLKIM